jgi:hypothetical protein
MKLAIRLTLTVLILCAAAAPAQEKIDITRYDMHALLQLHANGADLAGGAFETDVFIYRGGPTVLAYSAQTGNARKVSRGVATQQQLMKLNQALAANRVGQQHGNCGEPAPDYVTQYALTWYGAKGRVRMIPTGGIYLDCPEEVERILNATCEFIWEVLGESPEICVPPIDDPAS